MALYEVTGPDGELYEFDGPEDATDKQLYDYAQSAFGAEQTIPSRGVSGAQTDSGYDYKSEETSGVRDVADVATGLVSGTAKAAGALVGLGSLVPGLHYVADPLSAWLQKGGEAIDEALLSDRQQEINQELSTRLRAAAGELGPDASTSDYLDAIMSQGGEAGSFIADHPGQIANLIATSIPYIFGGGLVTKGVKGAAELAGVKKVSEMGGITGAAVGEGAITSGEVTKNIIEQTGTSGDYTANRLAAVPAGLGTAGISLLSGRMSNKAGIADIDTAITNKIAGTSTDLVAQASKKGAVRSTLEGGLREGGEELLQGTQEKVFENLGTGEHLLSDVGGEAVMGMAAGVGQGAGINAIKSMSGSDVQLTEAQKEAEATVAAEQAQALEDEEFIADAGAITSTQDSRDFAVKWAERLGVSTEEVFQDPRFGIVAEEKEIALQEDITKEKRRKHANSFPDEKEWEKENEASTEQMQRINIANEDSALGAAFVAWQKENDVYDTNDEVIETFLSEPSIMDMVDGGADAGRAPYLGSLDAHADFKDKEAGRTEEEHAEAAATTAALTEAYNEAVAGGNILSIASVEQEAQSKLDPAEWAIAKRNNKAPKKGKKGKKPTASAIDNTTASDAEAPIIPPVSSPYRAGTRKDTAYIEATEALGDLEAYPEITKSIESKKGVYGNGETPFQRALTKAKLKKRISEMGAKTQTQEGATSDAESSEATKNLGKKLSDAITSGEIKLTNTQVKVLNVILDAIETDTLGEYFFGDSKTGSAALAKAAGLKGRSTADSAIQSIRGYFTDVAGEGTKEQLKKTKLRADDGKTLKESAAAKAAGPSADSGAQVLGSTEYDAEGQDAEDAKTYVGKEVLQDADETTTDEDVDSDYERTVNARTAAEDSQFGSGMGNVAAGGSQANIAAPDAEGKAWVDRRAKAKGKTDDAARLNKSMKTQEALVKRVMGEKGIAKQVKDTWDESKPDDAGSFDSLPTTAKFVWINTVGLAMESGDLSILAADASEISKKFSNKKEGTSNDKPNSEPKTKNEKVVSRQRQSDKRPERDGSTVDGRGKKGAKKVREPKAVVKKATKKPAQPKRSDADTSKAAQNQMAHADKLLGPDWMLDHPQLMEMLAQKKFGAFSKEVTAINKTQKKEPTKERLGAKGTGATQEAFDQVLSDLFEGNVPESAAEVIHYYDTVEDMMASEHFKDSETTSTSVEGVAFRGKVAFILENITKGSELASFMHEVGSHLGLDNLMAPTERVKVSDLIIGWATGKIKTDATTKRLAETAAGGVDFAAAKYQETHNTSMPKDQARSEVIAYFIEEAVRNGYKPTASSGGGKLMQRIKDSFQRAFNKFLGFVGEGGADLTTQDLLDLASGAARIAIERGVPTKASSVTKESINRKGNKKDLSNTRKVIHSLFGDTGIQHWETFSNVMKRASNETKFLHQFIEENKVKMPGASIWFNLILKAEETANQIKRHVEGVAVQAREMSDERLTLVNKFIADSTLDRAWGYDPKFKGKKVKVDKPMAARFNALSQSEQKLVRDVFAHGETMIQRKRAIAKAKGVSDTFFQTGALDGPYAPLKRFGSYVTTLKSGALLNAEKAYALRANKVNKRRVDNLRAKEAHFVVKFFDTIGEASRFKNEKKALYESATTTEKIKTANEGNVSNHKVLGKVLGTMKASNMDPAAYKAMESLVQEMYMSSLDESNARESQAKREGVAGFESNMVRSFLSHSRAEANLISQMEHGADIAEALVNAETEAKADPEELVPVYNMLVSHYTAMLEGKETPIQNAVAAFNTVWMLTSSVGYHFTNATQPLMVTVPVLSAIFGDYKGTMKALLPMFGTGYQVARDVVTFKKQNGKFLHRQAEVDFSKLDPKYKDLFSMLRDRKLLDVGMEQDLAEFTRMNTGSDMLNKASGAASDVTHRLYQAARVVEMYNRVSTAVAAHDMAVKNPGKIKHLGMSPVQFALKIVQDTQGDFSNTDAPRILKRLPKLMVQYRKYQFMMGWVYANAAKAAWAGTTAEEKAVGYKTLGYMLMHAGVFGGVRGLPFIGVVAGAYSLFAGGEEPEDIERIIGDYIDDPELATLIARGLPALIGIDMSTKLSQDKIFHPAPFVDLELSQEGLRDAFFGTFLGPTANTASSMVRSAEYAAEGNAYRSIETAMPKGIKSVMESWRVGTEGYSLRNGDLVADPSQFNKISLIANALGIPAADLSKLKWTHGQQYELKEYFSEAQSDIRNQYIKADRAGDHKKMAELETKFHELQDAKDRVRPFFNDDYKALKRTSIRSLLSALRRQGKRERNYRRSLGTD